MHHQTVGAIFKGNNILMVRHFCKGRAYWGLPGGERQPGETLAEAAVRLVQTETGVTVHPVRLLYQTVDETCFWLEVEGDPCALNEQARWFPLDHMTDDAQVERVLAAFNGTYVSQT